LKKLTYSVILTLIAVWVFAGALFYYDIWVAHDTWASIIPVCAVYFISKSILKEKE